MKLIASSASSETYMPVITIDTDDEFMNVRDCYYYLKNPRMADHTLIQKFLQSLLETGLVFKERNIVDTGTLFENYIKFLNEKIYYDAMRDIREKIISKCIFFPTIAEILSCQEEFEKEKKFMIIGLSKSLESYINTIPEQQYIQLSERMNKVDKKDKLKCRHTQKNSTTLNERGVK